MPRLISYKRGAQRSYGGGGAAILEGGGNLDLIEGGEGEGDAMAGG